MKNVDQTIETAKSEVLRKVDAGMDKGTAIGIVSRQFGLTESEEYSLDTIVTDILKSEGVIR